MKSQKKKEKKWKKKSMKVELEALDSSTEDKLAKQMSSWIESS